MCRYGRVQHRVLVAARGEIHPHLRGVRRDPDALFSHGIESLGYASIDRWRAALAKARRANGFLGVDERAYPRDFATFTRYSRELEKLEEGGSPVPPLELRRFDEYVEREGPQHGITVAAA
jgi:hypothetical protein